MADWSEAGTSGRFLRCLFIEWQHFGKPSVLGEFVGRASVHGAGDPL